MYHKSIQNSSLSLISRQERIHMEANEYKVMKVPTNAAKLRYIM